MKTEQTKLRLESWPLGRQLPSPRNARTHSPAQVAEIASSIRAFGFANPILVGEEGDIIAGHGRLAAAQQLGLVDVPVIVLSGLSEAEKRQLLLADNRIALNAGWNFEMLSLELKDLSLLGADLSKLGFTAQELARALSPASSDGLTDENDVPETPKEAVTRAGDLWCAGPHRIGCGDCTDADLVSAVRAVDRRGVRRRSAPGSLFSRLRNQEVRGRVGAPWGSKLDQYSHP
jgi:ParB/Sulfiredoxin domain